MVELADELLHNTQRFVNCASDNLALFQKKPKNIYKTTLTKGSQFFFSLQKCVRLTHVLWKSKFFGVKSKIVFS